ncbi:MAG TPA: MATE family efflux transporter, partial [Bacteroidia bacterium]|nr:MATE family efflux transporter [Bacteroidia bacterium]
KTILISFRKEKVNMPDLKLLFNIGIGPSVQYIFEVAAFAIAGFMAGWLGKITFAAHGISLSIASFTYMFASGISGASSIRVATFKGAGSAENSKRAGLAGIGIAACIMTIFALCLIVFNHLLPTFFSQKTEVIKLSSGLLLVAALFQLFDGVQVTALGVLRGLSDVKIPAFVAMIAYWGMALPAAYLLGFKLNMGVYGIWFGLCLGLMFAAIVLFARFHKLAKTAVLGH